jgi:hypothetical protein
MVNRFLKVPAFFYSNLSCPSGIATCTALHAIRRFRMQYCSRSSDPDKYIFFLYFPNFSYIFRERKRIVSCNAHANTDVTLYLKPPFVSGLKGIGFLFAVCKRGLDTACKIEKIRENIRVLHAVIKYLLTPCKRVSDCL